MMSALQRTRKVCWSAAFLLPIIASVLLAQGGNQIAASAVFRDLPDDNIRSDDLDPDAAYTDGTDCVTSWVNRKTGFFFLRSVGPYCQPGRHIVLDFRTWVGSQPSPCEVDDALGQLGELNICGANTLPDVRIIADALFQGSALSAGTNVKLPFNLVPNFTSGQAFDLEFEQAVAVTGLSINSRILTAGPSAVAELYRRPSKGKRVSLGRFYMPFQLTVTKQQP